MNCNCGHPVRFHVSRDGKAGYSCPVGHCKFYALAAVQCEGYRRVLPNAATQVTVVTVRFEALLHPETREPCVMLTCHGAGAYERDDLRHVAEDTAYSPQWHTAREAYVYQLTHYRELLERIKCLPQVSVEEIPLFFFRCVEATRQVALQCQKLIAEGRIPDVDHNDVVHVQLQPFQKEGVSFIIQHGGRGMIADDMGLGKTVQAIAVAHHYRDEWPVLVVCPMSLMENWAKEFNRFCGIPFARIAILQGTKARPSPINDIVIVSYSSMKCVERETYRVVILDESHYIKAGETKRSQLALRLCKTAERVLLLSGTPAMSRPIELYTQLQAIRPTLVPTKSQYGARYCNSFVSRFGVDLSGHSHTDELHFLLQHFVIRRTKKTLGSSLPSKSRQLLYVYITDKEKKALEKQVTALHRSIAASNGGHVGQSAVSGQHSSSGSSGGAGSGDLNSRTPNAFELKCATARAKIPAVQDYVTSVVEQHLDSMEKIIFFAHHQCMMEAIRSAVEAVRPKQPIDYIYISGETPAAHREQLAEHFRSEATCAVAILSMQSSGTGHNFTCASTVVFAELDWNPSTHLQCEDRVHRIGQSNSCVIKYLLADGTSDSVIWPLLQAKLSVTTAVLENNEDEKESCNLHKGADTRQVARRDVSPKDRPFQCTLDRFVRCVDPSSSTASGVGGDSTLQKEASYSPEPTSIGSSGETGPSIDSCPTLKSSEFACRSLLISVAEMRKDRPRHLAGLSTLTPSQSTPSHSRCRDNSGVSPKRGGKNQTHTTTAAPSASGQSVLQTLQSLGKSSMMRDVPTATTETAAVAPASIVTSGPKTIDSKTASSASALSPKSPMSVPVGTGNLLAGHRRTTFLLSSHHPDVAEYLSGGNTHSLPMAAISSPSLSACSVQAPTADVPTASPAAVILEEAPRVTRCSPSCPSHEGLHVCHSSTFGIKHQRSSTPLDSGTHPVLPSFQSTAHLTTDGLYTVHTAMADASLSAQGGRGSFRVNFRKSWPPATGGTSGVMQVKTADHVAGASSLKELARCEPHSAPLNVSNVTSSGRGNQAHGGLVSHPHLEALPNFEASNVACTAVCGVPEPPLFQPDHLARAAGVSSRCTRFILKGSPRGNVCSESGST